MKPIHYPYLDDKKFLKEFDLFRNKEQFVKIVILTWKDERVIAEIQGRATGGSISVNGKSSVRRTANINIVADENMYNIMDVRNLISINKKVEIEVGFSNFMDDYTEYPILWFPQGVYVMQDASIKEDTSGISISIQLQDKMCMLNGYCGGTFSAGVTFDSVRTESGTEKIPMYTILKRVVQEYGGEDPARIFINDVDTRIKKVMRWVGSTPAYLEQHDTGDGQILYWMKAKSEYMQAITFKPDNTGSIENDIEYFRDKAGTDPITAKKIFNIAQNQEITVYFYAIPTENVELFEYGQDIGFMYEDFYYPNELVCQAGENITTVLDKIKNTLGNYEYFYDLWGNFIFQEIRNYLNTTQATFDLERGFPAELYLSNEDKGKSVYNFDDGSLITSYACNPQYSNIKNDFMIWGQRSKDDTNNAGSPVHYHLAIDTKPTPGNYYHVILKKADVSKDSTLMRAEPITVLPITNQTEFNENYIDMTKRDIGSWYYFNKDYNVLSDDEEPKVLRTYLKGYYYYNAKSGGWARVADEEAPRIVKTHDWREELYFSGMIKRQLNQYDFYNEEMALYWPLVYDEVAEIDTEAKKLDGFADEPIFKGKYRVSDPRALDFYIDFIDTTGPISDFHIDNIGKRTHVVTDNTINCLFAPEVPNFVLILVKNVNTESEDEDEDTKALRDECIAKGQPYIQISQDVYKAIATDGYLNPAYDYIKNLLFQYLTYNETINISVMPIFYLEPNTRISIVNRRLGINGDYMLDSYNLPLDTGGTMSMTCSKALEKI